MKLSQALLGAIVIGIAVQSTSCSKEKIEERKAKKEAKKEEKKTPSEPCPMCGMG